MDTPVKCACKTCYCPVKEGKAVLREGKAYCSATCASECTQSTCVCIHESCDHKQDSK